MELSESLADFSESLSRWVGTGHAAVSGTGLWCLCKGSSVLPVGCLDCQMPKCGVSCVLGMNS